MRKIKHWLINKILPVWAKEELLKENARLVEKVRDQEVHIKELNAYIEGLEFGFRSQRRITINNHMGRYDHESKPTEEVKK